MSLELILSGMFAGKTTELIRRIRRYKIAKKNCLVIKYSKDIRYSTDGIATHDKLVLGSPDVDCISCSDNQLCELNIDELSTSYDVIGIDEVQFLHGVTEFCDKLANLGLIVIAAGLSGTFERKPFGEIPNLIAIADKITHLTSVCVKCGQDGVYSKRLTSETDVELIGGSEAYVASCRKCFFRK